MVGSEAAVRHRPQRVNIGNPVSRLSSSVPWGSSSCRVAGLGLPLRTLAHQVAYDAAPLRVEWFSANGLSRSPVPVSRVLLIAFLAMQVGVHPGSLGSFILLCPFMC